MNTFKRLSILGLIVLFTLINSTPVLGLSVEQKRIFDAGILYFDADPATCAGQPLEPSGNSIYLIGDSWLDGLVGSSSKLLDSLSAAGYTVTGSNAVNGRSISGGGGGNGDTPQSGIDGLKADVAKIQAADKIVVLLGTNGDSYDARIPDVIKELSGKSIFWVNTSANKSDLVKNFNSANKAIQKHSTDTNGGYTMINWFSRVYPSDDPTNVDPNARSPLMSSDLIHPSSTGYKELAKLILDTVGPASAGNAGGTAVVGASKDSLPEVAKQRLSVVESRVTENLPVYQTLAAKYSIPWQIFAALHYREASNDPGRSMLGGEPLREKAVDSDNTPQTLEESGDIAYGLFTGLAKAVYDVEVDANMSFSDLQQAFLAYHRGFLYAQVPIAEGGPWSVDIAPYVMNFYSSSYLGPAGLGMSRPIGISGSIGGTDSEGQRWGETISGNDARPGAMAFLAYFGLTPDGSNLGEFCRDGKNVLNEGQLMWPVTNGGSVTSCWSDLRHKTISGGAYYHSGLDIAGAKGAEVRATLAGRVVFAGGHSSSGDLSRGYGNLIIIEHANGLWSHYGHLSAIGVSVEDIVSQGEKIGEVGDTGISLGDHLHFNLYNQWPFGTLPEGAGIDDGTKTLNPLTNGLSIPDGTPDIAGCESYPEGGREVWIDI